MPKLIKDPIHGYVVVEDGLIGVVDSYAFQRLRRIQQLPLSHLVYPGARHTRFDHSLGCMALAEEFARHLRLDEEESRLLKAAALLHDVGHTPYSHLLEVTLLRRGITHERMGCRIVREDEELRGALEDAGIDPSDVTDVLEGRHRLSSVVSGPLDVDRLDFLLRDAYFTGATYGIVDVRRLIHLTRLREDGLHLEARALGAIEELAIARHHSFLNVYFHHAVRAAQLTFLRGYEAVMRDGLDFASMKVPEYLSHDDYTVWTRLKSDPRSRWAVEALERRRLPKMVMEVQLGPSEAEGEEPSAEEVEREVSEALGVERSQVYFDSSTLPPLRSYASPPITIDWPAGVPTRSSWIIEMTSRPLKIYRVYVTRGVVDPERARDVVREVFARRGFLSTR
ncbi:MAG: HD domain-containing protein [Nitrososphaeria archaeon]|nr:HD domain-containing protein [Nitrososphaeria archaeon]MDW8044038.1 HD domain-containing protein [Nitrososphaerota archaeon]